MRDSRPLARTSHGGNDLQLVGRCQVDDVGGGEQPPRAQHGGGADVLLLRAPAPVRHGQAGHEGQDAVAGQLVAALDAVEHDAAAAGAVARCGRSRIKGPGNEGPQSLLLLQAWNPKLGISKICLKGQLCMLY